MSEIKISGLKDGLESLKQSKIGDKDPGNGFDEILKDAIGKISQVESDVKKAVNELASGGDVIEAVMAMEKADMSFQLMIEVRNRLLSAYEEISRMQV
ncbi:MAG TPA: flagellar hook-basal body complex protein FliE [Thermodesulfobacteriota bacterium]|jgi:flagellar hook-basal body complex protein FliE|nr:flagellar hook-basal body complex protein FliE [Thermodesulfobacteriota bacterium]